MKDLTLQQVAEAVGGKLIGDGTLAISGVSTDSRTIRPSELFIALRGEKFDGYDFIPTLAGKCVAVVTEKEFPGFQQILVKDTLKAFGRLAAYWKSRVAPRYTVGVTGSVGKTTTKDLIAGVLNRKYKTHFTSGNHNNHVGVPITLISIEEGTEAVVVEMGMSARGEIEYLTGLTHPNVAVITNIGTAHMEILGSREAICEAKLEILKGMEKGSTIILDGDEPLLRSAWAEEALKDYNVVFVGFGTENDLYPLDIYKGPDSLSFDAISPERELRVTVPAVGDHFIKDALFAVAVGEACGVDDEGIRQGLLAYAPTGLRQKLYDVNGIRVIADCYNASPESMSAALKVLGGMEGGRRVAVLGDMLELGCVTESAHRNVGAECVACGVDRLFTFGKVSYHILLGARDAGMDREKVSNSIDREQTAEAVREYLKPGDTVLFKASRRMKLEEIIALCGLA